jgi:hypothetical protein
VRAKQRSSVQAKQRANEAEERAKQRSSAQRSSVRAKKWSEQSRGASEAACYEAEERAKRRGERTLFAR